MSFFSSHKLKPLNEQVIVVTGASSGIGLLTAVSAAKQGAKVVLLARSFQSLQKIVDNIQVNGGDAIAVRCDVCIRQDIDFAIQKTLEKYGRIDTWVNNAGIGMWGRLDETKEEDARKLFDINFFGLVNCCLAVLPSLKLSGGCLINVGSEVSDAYIPLQGMYTATKHAVKGYTDSLRVELEKVDKAPVVVTLIQPTAVNTPFPQHAKNYTDKEPKLPTPMIDPQQVADAILSAAVTPTRDKCVGVQSKLDATLSHIMPKIVDVISSKQHDRMHYDEPPRNPNGALYDPSEKSVVGITHGTGGVEPK